MVWQLKALVTLLENPVQFLAPTWSLWLPLSVTPVSGDPITFSDLQEHQVHTWYTVYVKIKIDFKINKNWGKMFLRDMEISQEHWLLL